MTDKFEIEPLPYKYDALEPSIDEETMKIHHDKHYAAYMQKYVAAIKGTGYENMDVDDVLAKLDEVPEGIRTAVRNNGGGVSNHQKFWTWMTGEQDTSLGGDIMSVIEQSFGGFDEFKNTFKNAAIGLFGSGWAWLVLDGGTLKIMTTANQDSPISQGLTPILGLDLWEHSFYLQYQNRKPDYIDAWWSVVNWEKVAQDYDVLVKQ